MRFIDLGVILRSKGLEQAHTLLMEHLKKIKPAMVVVDSFKVFDDLAQSREELRKFGYEIAVNLTAWQTTALLLGEYGREDIATNPIFSIVDGLVTLTQRESSGEQQRYFQTVKMRGTAHSRDEHAFVINANGIELYAPRVTIQREPSKEQKVGVERCKTGIARLDDILGPGIPRYLEIYKLRNTAHLKGRHSMTIGQGGMTVFPRYWADVPADEPPPSMDVATRLASGIPGLDDLIGGGLLRKSMTLVSGSAGTGKTTLALQFLVEGARRREPGVYVTLEEGPAQVLNSADVLGLPLRKAVKQGRVEIVYPSRELVRGGRLLAVLADKIKQTKARRLVLDSVSHVATFSAWQDDELRQLLYKLVMRCKALGVTSLFTLESKSMFVTDSVTDHDFSPVADNLLMLRYVRADDRIDCSLTVVKTRGSAHDRGVHVVEIGKGGIRIGQRIGETSPSQPSGKRRPAGISIGLRSTRRKKISAGRRRTRVAK